MSQASVTIERLVDRGPTVADLERIDRIFFSSSSVTSFSGPSERAAFRERWLGRYLVCDADNTLVAVTPDAGIVGYVIGGFDDVARLARFADMASARAFAAASVQFPAHLHINIDQDWRSQVIGERLIEAFASRARQAGVAGMHVVTGGASRNVRFYNRCGFAEIARLPGPGGDKVLLGRGFRG